jgi:hypothetical protein
MKFEKTTGSICVLLVAFAGAGVSRAAELTQTEILVKATSPFEDIVKYSLDRKQDKLAKAVMTAKAEATAIRGALPEATAVKFDELFSNLNYALPTNNVVAARNAVDVFKLLIENMKPEGLKLPIEVEWLDYAGFNLHVLASETPKDWNAMSQTTDKIAQWWDAIKNKVSEKNLRYTMNSAVAGLQKAIQTKNLDMTYFAAQMDLEIVDLLENHFEKK